MFDNDNYVFTGSFIRRQFGSKRDNQAVASLPAVWAGQISKLDKLRSAIRMDANVNQTDEVYWKRRWERKIGGKKIIFKLKKVTRGSFTELCWSQLECMVYK